ncbi:MAG: hypothetical protein ACTSYO_02330 [Candidatus Ranarchaeia archaeon]
MPPSSLSKEDIKKICEEYDSGRKNSTELAREFNVNSETIRRWLKKNHISMRESRDSLRDPVNEHYFSTIDVPEKAYWLGFLAADVHLGKSAGSIRSVRLYLAEKDEKIIEQFAKDIEYEGRLRIDPIKRQAGIVFNSPQMCSDLIDLGMLEWKKDDIPKLLCSIPNNFHNHFVRGFFDGDGCISCNANNKKPTKQYYVNFCANKLWINTQNAIEDLIVERVGFKKNGVKIRTNSSSVKWVGNKQVEKFGDWLYRDHNRRLDRKYVSHLAVKNRDFLGFWQTFHKWEFKYDVRELKRLKTDKEINDIIDRFTEIVRFGFEPLEFKGRDKKIMQDELYDLEEYGEKVEKAILEDTIKTSQNVGQNIILHHQPAIWGVSHNGVKTFNNLANCKIICRRAIKAMLTSGRRIYPKRLRRELEYAGISKASILAVPTIMAAIKKFNLSGKWFDPCAGWGTRLLAANVLRLPYEATDPAVQYYGLERIKAWLEDVNTLNSERINDVVLHNEKFQDLDFPDADFLFTSPPFYNKEDYGLWQVEETFEEWYKSFIVELVSKARAKRMRIVLHIDDVICERLEQDYNLKKVRYRTGRRSKAPNEWFVEIL